MRPYIGITGFMSRSDAEAVLEILPPDSSRLLMVGVLASQKTVLLDQQNKWPNRYPKKGNLATIFPSHPAALNLIHFNTKEPETLARQLVQVTEFGGPRLHGFQLNIAWPSPAALEEYHKAYPLVQIVLQIGNHAFEAVEHSPEKLAERVATEYGELVDYLLLDPSGGYGKPFDTERARGYLRALREKDVKIGLGVAGGLDPGTLAELLEPLVEEFPDISIDAEGRLRDGNDMLDLERAKAYVAGALKLFGGS